MQRNLFVLNRFINLFKLNSCVNFSSVAERVIENNPTRHQFSHVGKFYKISKEDFGNCFEFQLKSDFCRLLCTFEDHSILIRKEAVEVIDYIRNTDFTQPVIRYVLYGRTGTGKTVTMAHISHYAISNGDWLLVRFQDLKQFLHFSKELTTNTIHENLYDTPTLASNWLQSFLTMNSKFLSKYDPKLLKRIEWNQNESLSENTPWTEMISFAIARPKYACDCIGILLREAREHAVLNHFKVMGLIHGINSLWHKSRRCDLHHENICASRISVLNYVRRFIRSDWINGALVCSVDREMIYNPPASATHYPRDLLGHQGFKDMDPFVPIHVPNFTAAEVANYLNFLTEHNWLTVESAKDPQGIGRREIVFLADNRPLELFNVTMEW